MVNAQEYIENNFSKYVEEIDVSDKNLEGDLDLSEYSNLVRVNVGINPQLRSLKLASLNQINWISLYKTSINNFSFLSELPDIQTICLPRTGDQIGEEPGNSYIAKVIREIVNKKNRELENKINLLKQQITYNINLNQGNAVIGNTLRDQTNNHQIEATLETKITNTQVGNVNFDNVQIDGTVAIGIGQITEEFQAQTLQPPKNPF